MLSPSRFPFDEKPIYIHPLSFSNQSRIRRPRKILKIQLSSSLDFRRKNKMRNQWKWIFRKVVENFQLIYFSLVIVCEEKFN